MKNWNGGEKHLGKLGKWSYPYIKVSKAFDIANTICSSPYNGEISVSGLAQERGLKERTGGFGNLVKSLKDYGLVEGRGTLKATELAKKIAVGNTEEKSVSKAESFLKIELFGEINRRIGINVPDKQRFSNLLGEITKADRLDVTNKASTLRNLYLDGCRYLKQERGRKKERLDMEPSDKLDKFDKTTATSGGVLGKLSTLEYGTFMFKDKASIAVARKILDLIESQLDSEGEETSEEEG
jgi:hypothetical protein